jgi:hypothetical protein
MEHYATPEELRDILLAMRHRFLRTPELYKLLHSVRRFGFPVREFPLQQPASGEWGLFAPGTAGYRADGHAYERKIDDRRTKSKMYYVLKERSMTLTLPGRGSVVRCSYAGRADLATFSRRVYWLLDSEFGGAAGAGAGAGTEAEDLGPDGMGNNNNSSSSGGGGKGGRKHSKNSPASLLQALLHQEPWHVTAQGAGGAATREGVALPQPDAGAVDPWCKGIVLVHYIDTAAAPPPLPLPSAAAAPSDPSLESLLQAQHAKYWADRRRKVAVLQEELGAEAAAAAATAASGAASGAGRRGSGSSGSDKGAASATSRSKEASLPRLPDPRPAPVLPASTDALAAAAGIIRFDSPVPTASSLSFAGDVSTAVGAGARVLLSPLGLSDSPFPDPFAPTAPARPSAAAAYPRRHRSSFDDGVLSDVDAASDADMDDELQPGAQRRGFERAGVAASLGGPGAATLHGSGHTRPIFDRTAVSAFLPALPDGEGAGSWGGRRVHTEPDAGARIVDILPLALPSSPSSLLLLWDPLVPTFKPLHAVFYRRSEDDDDADGMGAVCGAASAATGFAPLCTVPLAATYGGARAAVLQLSGVVGSLGCVAADGAQLWVCLTGLWTPGGGGERPCESEPFCVSKSVVEAIGTMMPVTASTMASFPVSPTAQLKSSGTSSAPLPFAYPPDTPSAPGSVRPSKRRREASPPADSVGPVPNASQTILKSAAWHEPRRTSPAAAELNITNVDRRSSLSSLSSKSSSTSYSEYTVDDEASSISSGESNLHLEALLDGGSSLPSGDVFMEEETEASGIRGDVFISTSALPAFEKRKYNRALDIAREKAASSAGAGSSLSAGVRSNDETEAEAGSRLLARVVRQISTLASAVEREEQSGEPKLDDSQTGDGRTAGSSNSMAGTAERVPHISLNVRRLANMLNTGGVSSSSSGANSPRAPAGMGTADRRGPPNGSHSHLYSSKGSRKRKLLHRARMLKKLLFFCGIANGRTVLHLAASAGEKGLVELLLQAGAKRSQRDDQGQTAADAAMLAGHSELAALLRPSSQELNPQTAPRGETGPWRSLHSQPSLLPIKESNTGAVVDTKDRTLVSAASGTSSPRPVAAPAEASILTSSRSMSALSHPGGTGYTPSATPVSAAVGSTTQEQRLTISDRHLLVDAFEALSLREKCAVAYVLLESSAGESTMTDPTSALTASSSASDLDALDTSQIIANQPTSIGNARSPAISGLSIPSGSFDALARQGVLHGESPRPLPGLTSDHTLKIAQALSLMNASERADTEAEARRIQTGVRAWLVRRNYDNLKKATRTLQRAARRMIERRKELSAVPVVDGMKIKLGSLPNAPSDPIKGGHLFSSESLNVLGSGVADSGIAVGANQSDLLRDLERSRRQAEAAALIQRCLRKWVAIGSGTAATQLASS